uniref:Glycoside hydrolase family 28 protein n=1 Tax=Acrobeloides nanus TaxID=290746 RepID=A0A914BZ35_9BILA
MFNIGADTLTNAHIYNINITAPGSEDPVNPSHNTDGIDVGNSVNVLVENSHISTDVAILANSGWRQVENITFRNLTIGHGHGLTIGADYAIGGIRNVTFTNIVMTGSGGLDTGPNVIVSPEHAGLVQDITYSNIQLYNVGYCITGIVFNNIVCHTANYGWNINGLSNSPIQGSISSIAFANVTNLYPTCQNYNDSAMGAIDFSG